MRQIPFKMFLFGPCLLMALGFTLNATVMAANGGTMPVLVAGCTNDLFQDEIEREGRQVHSCMTRATRMKFLADWISIRHHGIASPGDFFEWGFELTYQEAWLIWCVLVILRRPYAQRP